MVFWSIRNSFLKDKEENSVEMEILSLLFFRLFGFLFVCFKQEEVSLVDFRIQSSIYCHYLNKSQLSFNSSLT